MKALIKKQKQNQGQHPVAPGTQVIGQLFRTDGRQSLILASSAGKYGLLTQYKDEHDLADDIAELNDAGKITGVQLANKRLIKGRAFSQYGW